MAVDKELIKSNKAHIEWIRKLIRDEVAKLVSDKGKRTTRIDKVEIALVCFWGMLGIVAGIYGMVKNDSALITSAVFSLLFALWFVSIIELGRLKNRLKQR